VRPLKHYTELGVWLRRQLLEHCVMLSDADKVHRFETRDMETSKEGLLHCLLFQTSQDVSKKVKFYLCLGTAPSYLER